MKAGKSSVGVVSTCLVMGVISLAMVAKAGEEKKPSDAMQKVQEKFSALAENCCKEALKDNLDKMASEMKIGRDVLLNKMREELLSKYKKALTLTDAEAQSIEANKFNDQANLEKVQAALRVFAEKAVALPAPVTVLGHKVGTKEIKEGIELEFAARVLSGHLDMVKESQKDKSR